MISVKPTVEEEVLFLFFYSDSYMNYPGYCYGQRVGSY